MRTILLTGAGTVLGCSIGTLLAGSGRPVVGVYRTKNYWTDKLAAQPGVDLTQTDLSDSAAIGRLNLTDCDTIVHLAATSPRPTVSVADLIRDNVLATNRLVSRALEHGVKRLIFTSSMSVYGQVTTSTVSALTPIINPSPYGVSKRLCEQQLEDVSHRMASVALRIPALLGHGAHRHWLGNVMERSIKGDEITIFNPSSPYNNAVDIAHLSTFIERLLTLEWTGFSAFPLGAKGYLPVKEIVHRIVGGMKSRSQVNIRESSAMSFTIDYSTAEQQFRYSPPTIDAVIDSFIRSQS